MNRAAGGNSSPPTEGATKLANFLELRDELRRRPIGDGGRATCEVLSDALDAAVSALFGESDAADLAIVAVGGFGRREQCLYSDVDIMLLHAGGGADPAVRSVLYPLWDSGLKVGHSVRTVSECVAAARADFATSTTLLSARPVAGNAGLVDDLAEALARYLRGHPLASQLAALERARRRTDPYPLMAADIKSGRGGLRTFQGFYWERRRAALTGNAPPHEMLEDERLANNRLLSVRNALHAVAGKAADVFVPDLREGAARWLDVDLWEVCERVTRSLRTGDRLAVSRWPGLTTDGATAPTVRRLRRLFSREPANATSPRALGRVVGTRSLDTLQTARPPDVAPAEWTAQDRADLMTLLDQGEWGRIAFGWLDGIGWLDSNLPEFTHTIATPQLAAFHEHPVDTHLWRTVDEIREIIDGGDAWYASIAAEIGDRRLLLLAGFLHDVGKALPGDHSEVGAVIAEKLCSRIGMDDVAEPIGRLVRLHLVLADAATKRDTSDPRVLAELADQCGDLRTLQALYLLTVADAKATGRTMWTEWKATLLKNLYVRLAGLFEPEGSTQGRRARLAGIASAAGVSPAAVDEHAAGMDTAYLTSHTDDEIAAHCNLAAGLDSASARVRILDSDRPAPRLVVVASDRPGLLAAVAGVLTVNNLEVLDARLETRADGVACDTFHVRQVLANVPTPTADELAATLRAAIAGTLDLEAAVAAKVRAYHKGRGDSRLVVRTPLDPTLRFTALEVRCADRPGRLYEIVQELHAAGLDIRRARIDTRGDEVRDLFYVLRDGAPIDDVNEIQPLIARLRRTLRLRLGPPGD